MAKDIIHDAVKHALIKDGWTITDDQYTLRFGDERVYADLAAEHTISPERVIVVEIKSFVGASLVQEFEKALGQYMLYAGILKLKEMPHKLYLALSDTAYYDINERLILSSILKQYQIPLIVVDITLEEIVKWIN